MVIRLASDFENVHFISGDEISSSGMNFYKLILDMKDSYMIIMHYVTKMIYGRIQNFTDPTGA